MTSSATRLTRIDRAIFSFVDGSAAVAPPAAKPLVTLLDRAGHVAQQPPTWVATAGALAACGRTGRRAAARGVGCYAAAAVVANLVVKPFVGRPRPRKARRKLIGPVTTSFPSGHGATDVAFVFGAAQEAPWTFLPLGFMAAAAHWSLVRSRGHYPSDVVIGGLIGLGAAWGVGRLWPPSRTPQPS